MVNSLISSLRATENGHSLFEDSVRRLDIPTSSLFFDQGKLAPVDFSASHDEMGTADSEQVKVSFPRTVARSKNRVLRAVATLQSPPTGLRVAVLFSGGPAAGGHNVIAGLKRILGSGNTLLGVKAGPKGLINGHLFEITDDHIAHILNTGGFDFLGSDRTKIKTQEQFARVKQTCMDHKLSGIVIVGGDDSNTNAAVLAEYLENGVHPDGRGVLVIGVPKTIDGDLQIGSNLPISFGFDTATRIYSELVGNILQDTPSSRKYWHFIKLMGRAASHVALEVALQTKPALTLISEEVAERKLSLSELVDQIAETVIRRAGNAVHHGVVLVPEGLIEFVPEMNTLLTELNEKLAQHSQDLDGFSSMEKQEYLSARISKKHAQLMTTLPDYIVEMLLADRDSHGNLQVSLIPTEQLLIDMTAKRIKEIDGSVPFSTQHHFFGYEGRCGAPTLFDAAYTYNLGLTAGSLILAGKTGYIACLTDLDKGGTPGALPLTGLLHIETRHGHQEMVIEKALVRTDSPAFVYFKSRRQDWAERDCFCSPGPRQLWGPASRQLPISVALNQEYKSLEFDWQS